MNVIGCNPLLPVAKLAEQIARPIVGHRRLDPDDWQALREYARLVGREKPRKPYIPAPVSDEQWDRDAAVDSRDWCGND